MIEEPVQPTRCSGRCCGELLGQQKANRLHLLVHPNGCRDGCFDAVSIKASQ